eukprot:715328-Lingulodinium_polyedra.AAC.1
MVHAWCVRACVAHFGALKPRHARLTASSCSVSNNAAQRSGQTRVPPFQRGKMRRAARTMRAP